MSSDSSAFGAASATNSEEVSIEASAKRIKSDMAGRTGGSSDVTSEDGQSGSAGRYCFSNHDNLEALSMIQALFNTYEYFTLNPRPDVTALIESSTCQIIRLFVSEGFDSNFEPIIRTSDTRKVNFALNMSTREVTRSPRFNRVYPYILNSNSGASSSNNSSNSSNSSNNSISNSNGVGNATAELPTVLSLVPTYVLPMNILQAACYYGCSATILECILESGLCDLSQIVSAKSYEYSNLTASQISFQRGYHCIFIILEKELKRALEEHQESNSSKGGTDKGSLDPSRIPGVFDDPALLSVPLTRRASNEVFYNGFNIDEVNNNNNGGAMGGIDDVGYEDDFATTQPDGLDDGFSDLFSSSNANVAIDLNAINQSNLNSLSRTSSNSKDSSKLGGFAAPHPFSVKALRKAVNSVTIGIGSHDGYKSPTEDRYHAATISTDAYSYNSTVGKSPTNAPGMISNSVSSSINGGQFGNITSENEIGCYCVFDGHGGYHYAECVSILLPEAIKNDILRELSAHRLWYRTQSGNAISSVLSDKEIDLIWLNDTETTPKIIAKILHRQFVLVDRSMLTVAELFENSSNSSSYPSRFGGPTNNGPSIPTGLTRNNSGTWGNTGVAGASVGAGYGGWLDGSSNSGGAGFNSGTSTKVLSANDYLHNLMGNASKKPITPSMFLRGGSTGVVVIVLAGVFIIGNVGDSPCIAFSESGELIFETVDHNPDNPNEFTRVKSLGAHVDVSEDYGDLRVYSSRGQIAVTRAFGQYDFKKKGGGASNRPALQPNASKKPCDINNYHAHIITAVPELYIWPRYASVKLQGNEGSLNSSCRMFYEQVRPTNNSFDVASTSDCDRFDYFKGIQDSELQLSYASFQSQNDLSPSNSGGSSSSKLSFFSLFSDSFTEALRDHRLKKKLNYFREEGSRPDQIIGNFLNNGETLHFIYHLLQESSKSDSRGQYDVAVAARELAFRQANKFNLFDQYLGDNTTIILGDLRQSRI